MIIQLEEVTEVTITKDQVEKHNKKAHRMGVGIRKDVAQPITNSAGVIMNSTGSVNQGVNAAASGASGGQSMGESLIESKVKNIYTIREILQSDLKEEQDVLKSLKTHYCEPENSKDIREVEETILNIEEILELIENNKLKEALDAYETYAN